LLGKLRRALLEAPRHRYLIAASSLTIAAAFYVVYFYALPPQLKFMDRDITDAAVTSPLMLQSQQALAADRLKISIIPKVAVKPEIKNTLMGSTLEIRPTSRFQVNTSYTVRVSGIRTPLGVSAPDTVVQFHTQGRPKVTGISDAGDLMRQEPIAVNFDRANPDIAKFSFALTPAVPFTPTIEDGGRKILLTPQTEWPQGTQIAVAVSDLYSGETAPVWQGNVQVHNPVSVRISPTTGQTQVTTTINVDFTGGIDQAGAERALSISPAVAGKMAFAGNTLIFTPSGPLAHGQTYTVTVAKGVTDAKEGYLPADVSGRFTTYGAILLSGASPSRGSTEIPTRSDVSLTFNQPVDHASAQARASISPAVSGTFSWSGNTMSFHPSAPLAIFTTYSFSVAPGVTATYGTPNTAVLSTGFQTVPPVTQLSMSYFHQQHSLTCEVASLRMALTHYGISTSETALMNLVGFDGPATLQNGVWGDPNVGFVGSINGNGTTTGYGVYWGPIASAASNYRPSQAFSGESMGWIAQQVIAGDPVLVWGTDGGGRRTTWKTQGGSTVNAVIGEHTYVVKGVKGTAADPLLFYIYDPIRGQFSWTPSQLSADSSWFGHSGVVVR
jgi:uncharacterized protein YvpB